MDEGRREREREHSEAKHFESAHTRAEADRDESVRTIVVEARRAGGREKGVMDARASSRPPSSSEPQPVCVRS